VAWWIASNTGDRWISVRRVDKRWERHRLLQASDAPLAGRDH
jgi:hypothetical protein